MARKIYKYPIEISVGRTQLMDLHRIEKVVHVGFDPMGTPCIWAEISTPDETFPHKVYVVGTGHPLPRNATHAGTFIEGSFVWHVYISQL